MNGLVSVYSVIHMTNHLVSGIEFSTPKTGNSEAESH